MNSRTVSLILTVFGLLLTALFARNGDLIWMALPFLADLGWGFWQSPSMEKINLQATRSVEKDTVGGISTLRVRVTVRNLGAETVCVQLSDPLRPGMRAVKGRMRTAAALAAGRRNPAPIRLPGRPRKFLLGNDPGRGQRSPRADRNRGGSARGGRGCRPARVEKIPPVSPAAFAYPAFGGLDPGPSRRTGHQFLGRAGISPGRPAAPAGLAPDGPPPQSVFHKRIRAGGNRRYRFDPGCPAE